MAKTERPRRRRLTPQQKRLVAFLTENPDATLAEAAAASGYSSASTVCSALNHSPSVQEKMRQAMEQDKDLNMQALRHKMKEGLNATAVQRSFDKMGNLSEEFVDPDYSTRATYLRLASRWTGLDVEKREISGPDGGPIPTSDLAALKNLTKEDLAKLIRATA